MGNLLFGGLKGMLEYERGFDSDLSFDARNIHFFTKEYIRGLYQQLSVKDLPEETTLPSFYIYSDEKSLESLTSNLPSSGKSQYREGHIKINQQEFSSPIEFRFRGGLPLHWLYNKKSFRVKLPPFKSYLGERQFNLVNPSTIFTVTDWISYDLARSVDLLTPTFFPARVFVNDATNGLHFFLSRIDESFLRKNNRMPGSIYSGDTVFIDNPFGSTKAIDMQETVFSDKDDNTPFMWSDYRLWKKNASRNSESKLNREDIKKVIEVINHQNSLDFMRDYDAFFDSKKFNLFWGLDSLVGGYHHDLYHNHKIYIDPYKGKVEPIEWDVRYWSTNIPMPDYPLLRQVKLNPVLDYERNLVLFDLWKKFPVEEIIKRIDHKATVVFGELAADPYRQQPDKYIQLYSKEKVVSFSMDEFVDAIEALKLTYQTRHKAVKWMLDNSVADYSIKNTGKKRTLLDISISGNSPIDINIWSIIPKQLKPQVEVVRVYQNQVLSILERNSTERLYPGKVIMPGNAVGIADDWTNLTYGKDHLENSSLKYSFLIKGIDFSKVKNLKALQASNSVTGKEIQVVRVDELPNISDTVSIHPWEFVELDNTAPENIILSGEITILQDRVFTEKQLVTILPGTVFKIAKGRSLVFYGKVLARGEIDYPIVFKQLVEGEPWGSIVIQGESASGSYLQHINASGGSVSTQGLIDYPGQLNIHDVSSFILSHCTVKDNVIGDDALHIAYSKGTVDNCIFKDTNLDALDMDIVEVTVTNSKFFNAGNDAIDLMSSNVELMQILVQGAGDKCFSVGEGSDVKILNSQLDNCLIGVAIKDESNAYLENIRFESVEQSAVALYRKNPRFSYGGKVNGKSLYGVSPDAIKVGEQSRNLIPDNQLFSAHDQ